jgi:hypothetical protein
MKRSTFKISTRISAVVWAAFAGLAFYANYDLGTIATLGGIALMFAWMYEQENITN